MPETDDPRIPTNLRAMMILEALGQRSEPLPPAEIGRLIGLPKQTVHRLCNTLLDEGYLARDEQGRGLRPGRRARQMASGILHASTSHIARHQILRTVAEATGETVNFVVPEDQGMSYKDRVETNWAFRIQLPVGSHVPFHCTASGKVFLSTLPKAEKRRLVNVMKLQGLTPNTLTTADDLLAELRQISRQGYALDNEEFVEGMVAVAVPVQDLNGRYVASVAVHGPVQRLSLDTAIGLAPMLTEASKELTTVLCG